MAQVVLRGLVQGAHDHPLAAEYKRDGAVDSFRATAPVGAAAATFAVARIEEVDSEDRVIGFFPVIARGEMAEVLRNHQWQFVQVIANASIDRKGEWTLSAVQVEAIEK
jgi:hypothetical protein